MPKAKFRRIEQKKTFTRREQYENALTRSRVKNRPKELSYVEIEIGDNETANVYFTDLPASVLKLRDPAMRPEDAVKLMIEILAECVIDPETGEPLMSLAEWEKEETSFISKITGAVMGLQIITDDEAENVPDTDLVEVEVDLEALARDPNPLDETPGSASPTISTANSESEAHQNGEEETSKDG